MESVESLRAALARIVDQLGELRSGTRKHRADLVLRAIQLRCRIARAEGQLIAPTEAGMRCVVQDSPFRGLCPSCPAASVLPGDEPVGD